MSTAALTPAPTRSEPVARKGFWRGLLWLAWRQHRWQIAIGAAMTVGMLIWMLTIVSDLSGALAMPYGPAVSNLANHDRLDAMDRAYSHAAYALNTTVFLPVLVGMFLGAPLLAREYEQRTLMLAWSQDLSPYKWLWGKLAILGTFVAACGAALAGMAVHVAHIAHLTGDSPHSLFEGTLFQAGGWMPMTLALAWLTFGVAVGAVARRAMPAAAVVLAAFIARTVLMQQFRPKFMTPVTATVPFNQDPHNITIHEGVVQNPNLNDMNVGGGNYVDAAGHIFTKGDLAASCGAVPQSKGDSAFFDCLTQHGMVGIQKIYQPASRMGTFHAIENSINLGLLVVSLIVTWWCVRKARTTV